MCSSCSVVLTRGAAPSIRSGHRTHFATAAGGGLDVNLTKHISITPIQVEYVMTQFDSASLGGSTKGFGDHQNDIRYSGGVMFKFGSE